MIKTHNTLHFLLATPTQGSDVFPVHVSTARLSVEYTNRGSDWMPRYQYGKSCVQIWQLNPQNFSVRVSRIIFGNLLEGESFLEERGWSKDLESVVGQYKAYLEGWTAGATRKLSDGDVTSTPLAEAVKSTMSTYKEVLQFLSGKTPDLPGAFIACGENEQDTVSNLFQQSFEKIKKNRR